MYSRESDLKNMISLYFNTINTIVRSLLLGSIIYDGLTG